jgi:DnaK suppressor protein
MPGKDASRAKRPRAAAKSSTAPKTKGKARPASRVVAEPRFRRPRPEAAEAEKAPLPPLTPVEPDADQLEILEMLLDGRRRLLRGIEEMYAEGKERSLATGDISDRAANAADGDLAFRLAEGDAQQIARIDAAIRRIRGGTYGFCEQCHKRIPNERLKIRPFSVYCVKCKADQEREQKAAAAESGLVWGEMEDEEEPL